MNTVTAQMLETMINLRGDTRKIDGRTQGVLIFDSSSGKDHEMTVSQFDLIYKSFVRCWPVVKPLKESLVEVSREEGKAQREADRLKEKAEKEAKRKQDKLDMASKRAADKAAKEASKAKEKADAAQKKAEEAKLKAEADAKAAAQKKAEDEAKLKAAAERLATTGTPKVAGPAKATKK